MAKPRATGTLGRATAHDDLQSSCAAVQFFMLLAVDNAIEISTTSARMESSNMCVQPARRS